MFYNVIQSLNSTLEIVLRIDKSALLHKFAFIITNCEIAIAETTNKLLV